MLHAARGPLPATRSRAPRLPRSSVLLSFRVWRGAERAAPSARPRPSALGGPAAPRGWHAPRSPPPWLGLERPLPGSANAARRCRAAAGALPRPPRPPEASSLLFLITTITLLGHADPSPTRQVCWQKCPPFRVCFRLRRCFSAALAGASRRARLLGCRDPGGRGRLSAAPWEAAFCLWLLSGFSLYF